MSRFIDLIQPFNGVRFTRGNKISTSIIIGLGSVSAFLALNGTLSTDANGNKYLVNSKGADVFLEINTTVYKSEQMNFYSGDAPQYVQPLSSPLSIKETLKNGTEYIWTYGGTTQKLYKDGVEQTNATITEVNIGEISRLNGETESEIDTFELFNKVIKPSKYYKWATSNDDFIIVSNDDYILTTGRN